jgi:serine O-acetyltransferase
VPPGATVVGIPAHAVASRDQGTCERFSPYGTPAGGCPDPVLATVEALGGQLSALVDRMDAMQRELDGLRGHRRAPVNGSGESESTSDAALEPPAAIAAGEPAHH